MLCQTEKIAPGTVAMSRFGNAVPARLVARPEFCIPISMESAFVFAGGSLSSLPSPKPFYYLRDTRGFVILIGDAACRDYVLGLKFDDFQFGTFI